MAVKRLRIALIVALAAVLFFSCNSPSRSAVIRIDATRSGIVIPQSFLGFSNEWGEAKVMMGIPATGTNPIYRQLLANLFHRDDRPLIRIGGDSTDLTTDAESNGEPNPDEIAAFA